MELGEGVTLQYGLDVISEEVMADAADWAGDVLPSYFHARPYYDCEHEAAYPLFHLPLRLTVHGGGIAVVNVTVADFWFEVTQSDSFALKIFETTIRLIPRIGRLEVAVIDENAVVMVHNDPDRTAFCREWLNLEVYHRPLKFQNGRLAELPLMGPSRNFRDCWGK